MSKIFRYELYRMVFSRFYLGLTVITLWYDRQILGTVTILGTANTAPFSPWSFGSYLSQMLPFFNIVLLFILWNQCSSKARRTHASLLLVLMAIGILMGADRYSQTFFSEYPLALPDLEPVFSVPVANGLLYPLPISL